MTADPLANDLDLVEQARDGSQDAIVELWVRHYPAALSAARRTSRQPRDAEELASDAFSNMLAAFASGGGPTGSVRAYLLTSVRNLAVTRARRASSSEVLSDDVAMFEDGTRTPADPMSRHTEMSMMRQAFAALPRRWQIILWRTAVDHDRNIEIGQDLGITPNAVAALAKRARRGLRQAYLQIHLSTNGLDPGCEPFVRRLPMLAVDGSAPTDELAAHLATCRTCPGRLAELRRVEQQLGAMLVPAVLLTSPAFLTPALAGVAGAASTAAGLGTTTGGGAGASAGAGAAGTGAGAGAGRHRRRGRGRRHWRDRYRSVDLRRQADRREDRRHGRRCRGGHVGGDARPPRRPAAQPALGAGDPGDHPVEHLARTAVTHGDGDPDHHPDDPTPPDLDRPTRRALGEQPSPTPRATPPATTPRPTPSTTVAATPLRVGMRITGTPHATAIDVSAQSQGTTGPLRLTLRVPAGVTFRSASGDWRSCTQSGGVISCTAKSARGRWSGTIVTRWSGRASGRVTVEVGTSYADGGQASASASATWPP